MRALIQSLLVLTLYGVTLILPGCKLRPLAVSVEESRSHENVPYQDPRAAAQAAAEAERAGHTIAIDLLRELANRYRVSGRAHALAAIEAAFLAKTAPGENVVSAQLQAPPARPGQVPTAAVRKVDADTTVLLRQAFAVTSPHGALVHRCLDTASANDGKPTYNPRLFDWLCRAAILPEAVASIDADDAVDHARMPSLAFAVDRLQLFAERCKESVLSGCADAHRLIANLINQQPVNPVPHHLDKISVDRTAMPIPPPTEATATQAAN